ncbi:tetratricopeptide repeat protein [Paraflavitalea pollutisoli]|uniref:tetratricopeptide repeat protein n=1 Tax=Paraflavitalea pollutisoli TaxID=3034143 RepID=UPI0023EA9865|nr:tetratricopeptide repeat protein [Paraflavitalea sp. H1-2-19X]
MHEKYRRYANATAADTPSINRLLDYCYDLLPLDGDSALRLIDRAAQLSQQLQYAFGKGRTVTLRGMVYSDRGQYDSAILLYEQALSYFQALRNDLEIGKVYNNLGNVYHFQEMLQEAMALYLQSAAALERASASHYLAAIYTNIANVFQSLKQYEKGLTYTDKAEAIARRYGDSERLVNVLISRSVGQHNLHQAAASYQSTLEAMRLSDRIGYLIGSQVTRQNLADDLTGRQQYDSALYYLQAAAPLARRTGDPYYLSGLYMTYARVYADLHQHTLARDYALKVIAVSKHCDTRATSPVPTTC